MRVLGVAIEPPPIRTSPQSNQPDAAHHLQELFEVASSHGPGVQHHHRTPFRVGVGRGGPVVGELRRLDLSQNGEAESGSHDSKTGGRRGEHRHGPARAHEVCHDARDYRTDRKDPGKGQRVQAHRPSSDPLRRHHLARRVQRGQRQNPPESTRHHRHAGHPHVGGETNGHAGQPEERDGRRNCSGAEPVGESLADERRQQRSTTHGPQQETVGGLTSSQFGRSVRKYRLDGCRRECEQRDQCEQPPERRREAGETNRL